MHSLILPLRKRVTQRVHVTDAKYRTAIRRAAGEGNNTQIPIIVIEGRRKPRVTGHPGVSRYRNGRWSTVMRSTQEIEVGAIWVTKHVFML